MEVEMPESVPMVEEMAFVSAGGMGVVGGVGVRLLMESE
jgi:hypothetical protein